MRSKTRNLHELWINNKPMLKALLCSIFTFITFSISAQDSTFSLKMKLTGHTRNVSVVSFSPNGKYLATGSYDNLINIYQIDSLKRITLLVSIKENLAGVNTLYWSKDGNWLASGSKDFSVKVYDVNKNFQVVFQVNDHKDAVTKVMMDPKSKYLYTSSADGTLRFYDLVEPKNNAKPKFIKYSTGITNFLPAPDFKSYYIASKTGDIVCIDFKGTVLKTFSGHKGQVNTLMYTPDMKYMVSGSNDKTIIIWNMATGKAERMLTGHGWNVTSLEVSSDANYIVSTCNDGETIVWDFNTGKELKRLMDMGEDASSVSIHPNLHTIAVATLMQTSAHGAIIYGTPYLKVVKPKTIAPKPGVGTGKPMPPGKVGTGAGAGAGTGAGTGKPAVKPTPKPAVGK